jgi:hypothetical protein
MMMQSPRRRTERIVDGRSTPRAGGSEAIDLALQAAMIHIGRRGLPSLEGSYHPTRVRGAPYVSTIGNWCEKKGRSDCGKTVYGRLESRV